MPKLTYTLDDAAARAELQRLIAAGENPRPLLKGIGETLLDSTKRRFAAGTAPDGSRWPSNAQSTILRYLNKYKGSFGKRGKITQGGAARAGSKKPLIGESRQLGTQIVPRVVGHTLEIGSPMEYAGVQQFGARRGQFGSTRRGAPIPWGDIPARPFIGLSQGDRRDIIDLTRDYLAKFGRP